MLSLVNKALSPKHKKRKLGDIGCLVIHRTLDLHPDALIIEYKNTEPFAAGSYTGGLVPYHFYIPREGDTVQLLPLTVIGPAALKYNKPGIQIALGGDFRKKAPTPGQAIRLKHLCTSLVTALPSVNGGWLQIIGHTEDPKASNDANKSCPGKHLNLDGLRLEVKDAVAKQLEQINLGVLHQAGYEI